MAECDWQDDLVGKSAKMDRRSKRHIEVDDAAAVVGALRSWADHRNAVTDRDQWIQSAAGLMLDRWADSPVVLRVGAEFAGALRNSNTDVDLVPDWLNRFPFNVIAYSLASPLSLHDGHKLCHYQGMLVGGINTVRLARSPPPSSPSDHTGRRFEPAGAQFTRYANVAAAQGVRRLWVFKEDGDPTPQLQSETFALRDDLAVRTSLAAFIEAQIAIAREVGHSGGEEQQGRRRGVKTQGHG